MNFIGFSSYATGFSHIKRKAPCEDYAISSSYTDDTGSYVVCVVCDGHSDSKCFRSAKGARFGCEATAEKFKAFFEAYKSMESKHGALTLDDALWLKKSIKQCWDNKIEEDLLKYPITEEELAPLSAQTRAIYESGNGLQHIYGATLVAVAICRDYCIILHIGDGTTFIVDSDGIYKIPLPPDPKSDEGEPASLSDNDLFFREEAFRCLITQKIPQMAFISSDGISDSMKETQFMELCKKVTDNLIRLDDGSVNCALNEAQQNYLNSCVEYYAAENNGVNDDCSLAGFYRADLLEAPKVQPSLEHVYELWNMAVEARNDIVDEYNKRKRTTVEKEIATAKSLNEALRMIDPEQWEETNARLKELKAILKTVVKNEKVKIAEKDRQLAAYREYIENAGGTVPENVFKESIEIDSRFYESNNEEHATESSSDGYATKSQKTDSDNDSEHGREENQESSEPEIIEPDKQETGMSAVDLEADASEPMVETTEVETDGEDEKDLSETEEENPTAEEDSENIAAEEDDDCQSKTFIQKFTGLFKM